MNEITIPMFFIAVVDVLGIISLILTVRYLFKWVKWRKVPKSEAPFYETCMWIYGCIFIACIVLSHHLVGVT